MPLSYDPIVSLYDSSWTVQNKSTHTSLTRNHILELRSDVDFLGVLLSMGTTGDWSSNLYQWTKGTTAAIDLTDNRLWKSYITDLRAACEDLASKAGIAAPTWTIATASIKSLYAAGSTATTASSVLTQTGADFAQVVDGSECYIESGPGVTPGPYNISSHTTDTLTLSTDPGSSATGDIVFSIHLAGNSSSYTDVRIVSLYEDIRTSLITIAEGANTIFIDGTAGNDTTGDGTEANPYKTWGKCATELNAVNATAAIFRAGTYEMDTDVTVGNITLKGERADKVKMHLGANNQALTGSNTTVMDIGFSNDIGGSNGQKYFSGTTGIAAYNCIFKGKDNSGSRALDFATGGTHTFVHCNFIGANNQGRGCHIGGSGASFTFDDCLWTDLDTCLYAAGTITANYCGYYDYSTKTGGTATYVDNNEYSTSADPQIRDKDTGFLDVTSPYIDQASDSTKDIGCHEDGPYNAYKLIEDALGFTDSALDEQTAYADEELKFTEDLASETVNLTTDLYLGGLFAGDGATSVDYVDSSDALIASTKSKNASFEYNGASIDVSFNNASGNRKELYVRVVASGDSTDYDSIAWWEHTAYQDGDAARNYAGASTDTYIIDGCTECVSGLEWGLDYAITAATATNYPTAIGYTTLAMDEIAAKADIAIKYRIKDTVTGKWSEMVTINKTYNFNDWEQTVYYCGDNPRIIDDEYANHANYYAQPYHTGTSAYARSDGLAWQHDGRMYAYNPMYKSATLWYHLGAGSLSNNVAHTDRIVYHSIAVNFGNWNNAGDHCFATLTAKQPYDNGLANQDTSNVLGDGSTDLHYIMFTPYLASDCNPHSSSKSTIVRFPNGENLSWGDFSGKDMILADGDFYFGWSEHPFRPTCNLPLGSCAGHDNEQYLFLVKDNTDPDQGTADGMFGYTGTRQEYWVNTLSYDGSYECGVLGRRAVQGGSVSSPGCPNAILRNW